ncbi:U2 small nuclear ribonucleoprotein A' [Orchesella cincta]|uniref:Probable U2 small nuclear ribonucleoprotein A' n=1 Tax=Orchesella cincta TaxID=48709 RepID=A0A1D2NFL0_ORCCI|nr:U2 small nuclear ribonucleoprotein A' [Orchesella cincta]
MVKLTAELIQNCQQRINPVKDRELDLRGYKIPVIENMGATLNQFDTIDFSDNDIRKLDNFPLLPRLKGILMSNNRVVRIGDCLPETISNLETLILTNNMIQDLAEIDNLSQLKELKHLSLLFNPISTKEHYRAYVIFRLPQLKVLDFRKIKQKEKDDAKTFFKSKKGKEIRKEIVSNRSTIDDDLDEVEEPTVTNGRGLKVTPARRAPVAGERSAEVNNAIKEAIRNASSLEEVERLQQMLRVGQIPQSNTNEGDGAAAGEEGMDVN